MIKPIFSDGESEKTVILNWNIKKYHDISNMFRISEGYKKSVEIQLEALLKVSKFEREELVIFPILFNFNHSIELYLKVINWSLSTLLGQGEGVKPTHNIINLHKTVKSKVIKFEDDDERILQYNRLDENLKKYLEELKAKIINEKNIDFSRYPFGNKGNDHFYLESSKNESIDLENFKLRSEKILSNLSKISQDYLLKVENKE